MCADPRLHPESPPPPPPDVGSRCPHCQRGTILWAQCSTGAITPETQGQWFIKCSRCYRVKPEPPNWVTPAAQAGRCAQGIWYDVCGDLNPKPKAGLKCECKKGQRSQTCTHYLCKQCCLQKAEKDLGHVCALRDHRPTTAPPMSNSAPLAVNNPSLRSQPAIASSSLSPQTAPAPVSRAPHPFHAHNVSGYFLQNHLPPQYAKNSMSGVLSSPSSRAHDSRDMNNSIVVGWCRTADVREVDIEIRVSAPLPEFIPYRSEALAKFTRLSADELRYYSLANGTRWVAQSTGLNQLRADSRLLLGPADLAGQPCAPELIASFSPTLLPTTSSPLKRSFTQLHDQPLKKYRPSSEVIDISDDEPMDISSEDEIPETPTKKRAPNLPITDERIPFPPIYAVDAQQAFEKFEDLQRRKQGSNREIFARVFSSTYVHGSFSQQFALYRSREARVCDTFKRCVDAKYSPAGLWTHVRFAAGQLKSAPEST
ncbi:hypothetical protein MKEN_00116600 [Mycena kentingensis (nom. inval.)]|nr:hypothetical protein MKEN_00116600 [Mycena kentingensis (nom. inval.)]